MWVDDNKVNEYGAQHDKSEARAEVDSVADELMQDGVIRVKKCHTEDNPGCVERSPWVGWDG